MCLFCQATSRIDVAARAARLEIVAPDAAEYGTRPVGPLISTQTSDRTPPCRVAAALGLCVPSTESVLAPADRGVGYVPQDRALFPTMTVRENIGFALHIRRIAPGFNRCN